MNFNLIEKIFAGVCVCVCVFVFVGWSGTSSTHLPPQGSTWSNSRSRPMWHVIVAFCNGRTRWEFPCFLSLLFLLSLLIYPHDEPDRKLEGSIPGSILELRRCQGAPCSFFSLVPVYECVVPLSLAFYLCFFRLASWLQQIARNRHSYSFVSLPLR